MAFCSIVSFQFYWQCYSHWSSLPSILEKKRQNTEQSFIINWINIFSLLDCSLCFHSVVEKMCAFKHKWYHPKSSFWYWLNELQAHLVPLHQPQRGPRVTSSCLREVNCSLRPAEIWSWWTSLHHKAFSCSPRNFSWQCPQVMRFL